MRTPSAAVLNKECPDKIHPDTAFRLFWDVAIFFILVYFSVMIPLRIALILHPFLLYIDYAFDVINLVDCYLYSSMFAIFQGGQLLVKTNDIRWFYYQDRAIYDVISGFPYDLIVLGFLSYDIETILFIRAVLRLPKMLKFLLISRYFRQVERLMKILNVSFIIFRFLELTFSILIISHWTACVFYMFSNLGHLSDCVPEPDQYYAEACRFRGTWVEQQIATLKLPIDGGDQWTRLIRAFNWAIPTLTGESMGDCWVMNANEVLYAFLVMLFGLAINGVIIGSIMTLVSSASEETTKIYRKIELLRSYLTMKNVPADLIDSSISLLMHQASEEGLLTLSQDKIFSDLPHSIKISIDQYLKTVPFLRQCAFFDFCPDEVLRGISSKLKVCMYVAGDHIICCGDLGHDMFFLESGTVHVVSADGNTLYSTLEDGAFFGETALFFRSTRTATIKAASPICVCLQLTKGDLDHELRSLDYNDEEVLDSFRQLQITNQKRNAAVTTNLAASRDPNNKLFKLIHTADTTVAAVPILLRIRTFLCPDSAFRVVWDMLGLLFLMYYTFSIPFYIAFFFGEKVDLYLRFIAFDFLIDSYWVLDIIFKAFFFSFHINLTHTKLVTDGEAIFHKYYTSGNYYTDILASIPLEFFGLIPNTNRIMIFIFRMGHLLRFPQLVAYSNLVEYHLRAQLGINIARSTSLLTKAGVAYVILNHWLTCGYFMLHRYAERRNDLTFIIADKLATFNYETNEHDICSTRISFCYSRVIYFTVGIMAGIGYGDMSPYTSGEHVYQGMVAILGAYIAATVLGFVGAFLESLDANGNSPFKTKLREVEMYIDFRRLDPTLKDTILAQYTHTWNKNRSLGGMRNDVLNDLSTWKATELSLLLNADILKTVPMLRDATDQVRRHVALNLMPLIALANSNVYHAGDVGNSVFFVASGDINLTLSSDRSTLDSFGLVSLQILLKKQSGHGIAYLAGDHFGEFCLLSKSGLRAESARATIDSELYSLSKECIWDMFLYMTFHNRRRFVHQLMTRVGENDYIDSPLREFCEGGQVGDERIKFLFRLSYQVMKEIIEDMEVVSSAGESESDDSPDEDKDAQDSPAVRRASSGSVKLGRKSSSDGLASEHSFKQIKKILKEEQAVTISQRDKLYLFDDLNNSPSVLQHSSSKKTFSAPAMAMRINRQTSDHLPYDEAAEYHQSLRRNDSFHSTTSTDYSEFVSHNQFRINMSKFIVNASPSNKETSAEEPTTMPDVKRNSDPLPGAVMSVRFGSMESMGIPGDESIKSDKVEVDKQFSSNSIMSDLTVPTMLNLSPHQSPHASPHSSPIRIPVVSNLRKSALVNSSLATAGAKSLKKRRHSLGSFTPPPMIEEVKPWTEPKAPSDNGTIAVRRRSTSSAIEGNGIIDEESQKYAEEIELRITGHRTRSFNGSTLY